MLPTQRKAIRNIYSYIETDSHYYFDQVDCSISKRWPLWVAKILIKFQYDGLWNEVNSEIKTNKSMKNGL